MNWSNYESQMTTSTTITSMFTNHQHNETLQHTLNQPVNYATDIYTWPTRTGASSAFRQSQVPAQTVRQQT